MRVALVNPNTRMIGRVATTNPPMGLLYIASYLREAGHDVTFIDADVDSLSRTQVQSRVADAQVVGITMVTVQASFGYDLINHLEIWLRDVTRVVGGAHPSGMRERIFTECPKIDVSVIGEGEETMLELCNAIERNGDLSTVNGIIYKHRGRILTTPPRKRIANLDEIPRPAVDLAMPISRYEAYYPPNKGQLAFPVMASRGCPFRCKFCGSNMVWGWKVRFRSPKNIVDEIEWLRDDYDVDEIYFLDDTLNLNHKWFNGLCKEIIDRIPPNTMYFKGSVRANKELINRPLLQHAKDAGFWLLAFGVESGNQKILNRINKNLTVEEIERCMALLKEFDFTTVASFMIGNLGETRETVMETINFADKLKPDYYDFPIATPLPGTVYEKEAEALNLIRSRDWRSYAMGKAVCETEDLSLEELEELRTRAFTKLRGLDRIDYRARRLMGKIVRKVWPRHEKPVI